jgi:hypothetical protein
MRTHQSVSKLTRGLANMAHNVQRMAWLSGKAVIASAARRSGHYDTQRNLPLLDRGVNDFDQMLRANVLAAECDSLAGALIHHTADHSTRPQNNSQIRQLPIFCGRRIIRADIRNIQVGHLNSLLQPLSLHQT